VFLLIKNIHGGDIYSIPIDWLDYSANINPLGLSDNIREAFFDSIDKITCYPDIISRKLCGKIAEFENLKYKNVICGNGAADLIYKICYAIKPKKALLLSPTFSEYENALKNINCHIRYYKLKEKNDFKIDYDIINYIDNTDIIFICNPNNPTGITIENEIMYKIINKANKENCIVVVDECFNDFIEKNEMYSVKNKIKENKNLIVLKAFTKIFAIPGLRLGYALLNNNSLKEKIYNSGQPWSVSVVAENVGIACTNEKEYIKNTKLIIKEERGFLTSELKKIGFKVFESQTNYILFKSKFNINLCDELKQYKILIRNCSNYNGLDCSFYRIAVKKRNDNLKLLNALYEVVNDRNINNC